MHNENGRGSLSATLFAMTARPDKLRSLAREQLDVVSRAQLSRLGVDRHMVARRHRSGMWRVIGPRVVVLHTGTLTTQARWWVGVLHADLTDDEADSGSRPTLTDSAEGPDRTDRGDQPDRPDQSDQVDQPDQPDQPDQVDGSNEVDRTDKRIEVASSSCLAALAGLTAADAGGLTGFETSVVHVAVAHGREVGDLEHPLVTVRVHQTRHLEIDELHPVLTPARIRLPRAVVESASAVAIRRPRRARALIAAAVQQQLVRPQDLHAFATARRTLPGRRLLLETIADTTGGSHSLPELDFLRGLRRAGLPIPTRQRRVRRADGTWYLDIDFDEYDVTVEINGLQHYELLLSESDDFRRAVLQIGGRIVVDVSCYAVRHLIEQCMLLTAEALLVRGYDPPPATTRTLAAYRAELGWDEDTLRAS